jgi:pyruvate/2-oxoglutarate dehydrogenase complex dihydrolipoamide dehydrogenase (E3) component
MGTMAYDLVIIGSGPGGYSAAVRAAQFGLKTAIVEKDPKLGGTCLHVGCIPTKALLHSASLWQEIQHSAGHGILCDNPRLDFPKIIARKNEVVAKHAKGTEFLMKKNKVDWIKGRGKLLGGLHPHQHRNSQPASRSEVTRHHRSGRRGSRVRFHLPPLRVEGDAPRDAPARRARRRRGDLEGTRAALQEVGHPR